MNDGQRDSIVISGFRALRTPASIAVLVTSLGCSTALADVDFEAPAITPCSLFGGPILVGDVDGDHVPDVIMLGRSDFAPEVLVFHGNGIGFFDSLPRNAMSSGSAGVLEDLDDDGILDLAITTGSSPLLPGWVAIYRGDGHGAFVQTGTWSVARNPSAIASLDANGDGHRDLVVANARNRLFSLLLGDGALNFPVRRDLPTGLLPSDIATGDMNGDGFEDVVVACFGDDEICAYFGDGHGGFGAAVSTPLVEGSRSIALARLDGDELPDLAVVIAAVSSYTSVMHGTGDGHFTPMGIVHAGSSPQVVIATDIDRDGIVDLAISAQDWTGSSITLARGVGDGTFQPLRILPAIGAIWLSAADFDGDGWKDVVYSGGQKLVAYRSVGRGAFRHPTLFPSPTGPLGIAAGDLDGDSVPDVLYWRYGLPELGVFLGDGNGGLVAAPAVPTPVQPGIVHLADLDGDGDLDALMHSTSGTSIYVLLGAGDGGFSTAATLPGFQSVSAVATADFDADGILDLVVSDDGAGQVQVFHGGGDGSFAPGPTFNLDRPSLIATADFNEDGFSDMAVTFSSYFLTFLFSDGTGGLVPGPGANVQSFETLASGDMNGDGHADIVMNRREVATPGWVFLGDGHGTFRQILGPTLTINGNGGRLVDFDGDGNVDFLHSGPDSVGVLFGAGDGTFPSSRLFLGFGSTEFSGDFDRDGYPDIVKSDYGNSGIEIFLNRAPDPAEALRGNVNALAGPITDVLFANDSGGDGPMRTLDVGAGVPFEIRIESPPSRAGRLTPFAMYAWPGVPSTSTLRKLPLGLGLAAMPMPITTGSPRPRFVWNNLGHAPLLGTANHHSVPAPSSVFRAPNGIGRDVRFTLQGLVQDSDSPSGRAAITNGIVVVSST